MEEFTLKSAIEAILFASGEPVPIARISLVLGADETEIKNLSQQLAEEYIENSSGIRLVRLNESLQLCSAPEFSNIILKVIEQRAPSKLSASAMETLAIAAYFQPVTRAFIERVRGVDSSYTVGTLVYKGLLEPSGKLDAPGKPMLFRTTDSFLRVFGLSSLDELPELPNLSLPDGGEKLKKEIDKLKDREQQLSIDDYSEEKGGFD